MSKALIRIIDLPGPCLFGIPGDLSPEDQQDWLYMLKNKFKKAVIIAVEVVPDDYELPQEVTNEN